MAAVLSLGLLPATAQQQAPVPGIELPAEDAIQQGRNKGVPTWEGTLFGQDSYRPGSYAQIEVVANPGFEFEHWEGAQVANVDEAKTFVTMADHASIKAHYKRIWNVIAAPDNKEAGEVKGSGDYPDGTSVKLSVKPNDGFKFLGWEGKGINEEEKEALETTIIADGDHDIVARFENENQDENSGGGGGGGDSDQNEDSDENQDEDQEQNQDESEQDQNEDQQDEGEDEQDQNEGDEDEQPQEPEAGEDDPAEPEEGEDEPAEPEEGEQPESPSGEEEAPAQETPAGGQPLSMQMTPEEATRLLEAMEDGEKKLPLFIVTPPDQKKDNKKDW